MFGYVDISQSRHRGNKALSTRTTKETETATATTMAKVPAQH